MIMTSGKYGKGGGLGFGVVVVVLGVVLIGTIGISGVRGSHS